MKKISLIKNKKSSHISEEKFCMDKDDENYINRKKVKDHCHYRGKFRGAAHSKCNLNNNVPKDIPIIHNASYDTHFIIDQLAEEFKGELNCIGEKWSFNFLHNFSSVIIKLIFFFIKEHLVNIVQSEGSCLDFFSV